MIVEIPAYRQGVEYIPTQWAHLMFVSIALVEIKFDVPVRDCDFIHNGKLLASFRSNVLRIFPGYAWDGCSPKRRFLRLAFGTPDPPCSRLASKVHDLLYQFLLTEGFPFTRKQCDDCFFCIMRLSGFRFGGLYHYFVKTFGDRFARKVEGTQIIYHEAADNSGS
jgi:hypothetical protein